MKQTSDDLRQICSTIGYHSPLQQCPGQQFSQTKSTQIQAPCMLKPACPPSMAPRQQCYLILEKHTGLVTVCGFIARDEHCIRLTPDRAGLGGLAMGGNIGIECRKSSRLLTSSMRGLVAMGDICDASFLCVSVSASQ